MAWGVVSRCAKARPTDRGGRAVRPGRGTGRGHAVGLGSGLAAPSVALDARSRRDARPLRLDLGPRVGGEDRSCGGGIGASGATPSTRCSTARPRRTPFGCPLARANGDAGSAGTSVRTLVVGVDLALPVLVGLGVFANRRRQVGRAASASPGVSSAPPSPAAATLLEALAGARYGGQEVQDAATRVAAVTAHLARADGPTRT